jgi:RNA polymerase sigma-70 factor (ECF subfamily)
MLDRYVQAWQRADVDGLVDLLRRDAVMSMPPSPSWYQSHAAIRAFTAATVFGDEGMFKDKAAGRWRLVATRANGQPAFAVYQKLNNGEFQPSGIQVLTLDGDKIEQITCFLDPALPPRFAATASG